MGVSGEPVKQKSSARYGPGTTGTGVALRGDPGRRPHLFATGAGQLTGAQGL
ncbi:hypothetical protein ACFVYT_28085 [Streptomyces sp. NPDC058290]|uniref:hypothetical protein n=1 Tax=Streptomyces sp. NPDC058290 TaxID=3346426 RepID=UPI0036E60025